MLMVEVVVSMSGSCEPRTAKPNAIGSAVPMTKDVPAAAMVAWVMDMKPRNMTPVIGRDGTLPKLSTVTRIPFIFADCVNHSFSKCILISQVL